jgi:ubiquinone/menaquinone biosynthesis C-methylase UbiE
MEEASQHADKFLRRQRQKRHLAAVWARLAGLGPGMTALDIGSGGFILAAEYAGIVGPTGRLYALEPRYEPETRIDNLVHLAQDATTKMEALPALDVIFCTDTLHHAADPLAVLRGLRGVAGPGTILLVTEYDPAQPGLMGAKPHRRLAPEAAVSLLAQAGFAAGAPFATEDEHYAILAKPG